MNHIGQPMISFLAKSSCCRPKSKLIAPKGNGIRRGWNSPNSKQGKLQDGAIFTRLISVGKELRDRVNIKGRIRFQACTKEMCLRPQEVGFDLPLTVLKR